MEKPAKIDRTESLKWINLMEHTVSPFAHLKEVLACALQAEADIPALLKQRDTNLQEANKVSEELKKVQFDFNEERNKQK